MHIRCNKNNTFTNKTLRKNFYNLAKHNTMGDCRSNTYSKIQVHICWHSSNPHTPSRICILAVQYRHDTMVTSLQIFSLFFILRLFFITHARQSQHKHVECHTAASSTIINMSMTYDWKEKKKTAEMISAMEAGCGRRRKTHIEPIRAGITVHKRVCFSRG